VIRRGGSWKNEHAQNRDQHPREGRGEGFSACAGNADVYKEEEDHFVAEGKGKGVGKKVDCRGAN